VLGGRLRPSRSSTTRAAPCASRAPPPASCRCSRRHGDAAGARRPGPPGRAHRLRPRPARRAPAQSVGGGLTPSLELLASLRPDLVIAWEEAGTARVRPRLEALGIPVFAMRTQDTTDIFNNIARFGTAHSAATRPPTRWRAASARGWTRSAPPSPGCRGRRVLYVVGIEPPLTAGPNTFIAQLIEVAGGRTVFPDVRGDWPQLSLEEIVRRRPDVLVLPVGADEPASLERLRGAAGWRELLADGRTRVRTVPADVLNRPGPSIVRSAELLREAIHPAAGPTRRDPPPPCPACCCSPCSPWPRCCSACGSARSMPRARDRRRRCAASATRPRRHRAAAAAAARRGGGAGRRGARRQRRDLPGAAAQPARRAVHPRRFGRRGGRRGGRRSCSAGRAPRRGRCPLAAFVGAIVAIVLVLRIAASVGRALDTRVLLLAGVVVGAFFNACILLALTFSDAESSAPRSSG
jgi:ABC-type hemin transport system substrate-binding protein